MSHYKSTADLPTNVIARLDAARTLAGVPKLDPFGPLDAALADEPTVKAVAAELLAESATVEDGAAWLDEAMTRMQRARAVDHVRGAIAGRERTVKHRRPEWTADTVKAVDKAFRATVKRLTTAADKLPREGDPFDLSTIVATHATQAMQDGIAALVELSTWAAIHGHLPLPDVGPAQYLVPVVDVAQTEAEMIHPKQRVSANPSPVRDKVRAYLDRAERDGVDAALAAVARGDYGDAVTLALPATSAERKARMDRYKVAREVDTRGHLLPEPEPARPLGRRVVVPTDQEHAVTFPGASPFAR